ncbi:MAG: DUF362 domain-containing protein [Planctomycetes bacterium]|nr:DUF362 domain-containing protein [Planctomycetota bacterium]
MSRLITRREMLVRSAGAAGALAGLGLARAVAAPPTDRFAEAPTSPVAIERCESYEPRLVRERLNRALDAIGGIGKLVANKTVTVKLNLTGQFRKMHDRPACETYHTHPHVVAALCAALEGAGAKRIILCDALYYTKTAEEVLSENGWDLAAIRSAGGQKVEFVNTRNRGEFKSYSRLKVPWGGYLYPAFDVNAVYEKCDVFVSLAKLKNHVAAGVTMSVKNLFGITPTALYGDDAPNDDSVKARVAILHKAARKVPDGVPGEGDPNPPTDQVVRVPRIVADIMGARPVDLAVVEGITTVTGGEGFWIKNTGYIEPKLLLAGRNAVCTDAICTAVMGYDPTVGHGEFPFPGENHLRLVAQAGLGQIDPARIEVRGLSVKEVMTPFTRRGEAA